MPILLELIENRNLLKVSGDTNRKKYSGKTVFEITITSVGACDSITKQAKQPICV